MKEGCVSREHQEAAFCCLSGKDGLNETGGWRSQIKNAQNWALEDLSVILKSKTQAMGLLK